uniref:HTH OST-type domain-containing protein n=1 Tax=Caenorhabditis tropicalis TaxID=1561998 RepID=A0A1I7UXV0_9PELO
MAPRRINVTQEQKTDPLRKPKVELQGILVAEKQPITAKDIERRMMSEYGQSLDPKKYGCNTMDDLLQACSDTVVHQKRRDGVHVYMAKVNEANQDIVEMVQQQVTGNEAKRGPRSFLSSGFSRPYGSHGASFRNYKITKVSDDVSCAKGTVEQFKARNKLGPAKTKRRIQNLADLLNECRDEIGNQHPEEPNRKIVTLGALAEKFKQVYGLPAWGKNMTESELHKQLDVPEFAGVLKFWQMYKDGDVLVETNNQENTAIDKKEKISVQSLFDETMKPEIIHVKSEDQQVVNATLQDENGPQEEASVDLSFNQSIGTRPLSSADSSTLEDFSSMDGGSSNASVLITNAPDDGFFESGPGFGGNQQTRQTQSAAISRNESANTAQRFGSCSSRTDVNALDQQSRGGSSIVSQNGSQQGSQNGSQRGSQNGSQRGLQNGSQRGGTKPQISTNPSVLNSAVGSRTIAPQNPAKVLADYIKSRGKAKFDSLPEDDKYIVNFRSDIFKIQTTVPGEITVHLVDPAVDTATLTTSIDHLRGPVEADFRWMSEMNSQLKKNRRHYLKPVMFIPPRGFLAVLNNPDEQEVATDKMALMEDLLKGSLSRSAIELSPKAIRPGMAAVYVYHQGPEVRYYRVLIVGEAHQEKDIMVLLVDHIDQYLADVKFEQLFELPEKISFRHYLPNVVYAALYGVQGMSLEEQHILWRNVDDEERKQFVVGYIFEDDSKVLSVDMIWCDESGQLEWLSRIASRRGAMVSTDTYSSHLEISAKATAESFGAECFIDFIDYSAKQNVRIQSNSNVDYDEKSEPENQHVSNHEETNNGTETDLNPENLNLYAFFNKLITDKNLLALGGLVQFVRNVKETVDNTDAWNNLFDIMNNELRRNKIRL